LVAALAVRHLDGVGAALEIEAAARREIGISLSLLRVAFAVGNQARTGAVVNLNADGYLAIDIGDVEADLVVILERKVEPVDGILAGQLADNLKLRFVGAEIAETVA